MNTWTLLTAPGWVDKCPPMPGRNGPTYAEQISFVEKWMEPLMRDFHERQQWRKDHHKIYSLYLSYVEYARMFEPDPPAEMGKR